jgi:hypothetical protein
MVCELKKVLAKPFRVGYLIKQQATMPVVVRGLS